MARLARCFVEGQPQHIIQRGNNREPIFAVERDYLFYLECLQEAAEQHGLAIHSYVLMTNHVHLLVTPQTQHSIGKTLQSLGRRYVQHFNRSYRRTGTLWEGRYKATLIDSERYLLTCMRYIELNPVRAKMVDHPNEYPWSSYRINAEGESSVLLEAHDLYCRLGRSENLRLAAYRALFAASLDKLDVDAIREATNTGWALGDGLFRDKIERLSGRRTAPKSRGRPRKAKDLEKRN
ncbi:MAG: transposase [Gammaproteobacteria bacterium]|nr:transposase [Gammaproteobacteria bacterium]MBQ0838304.1 transposase [Gammaproteobacteria bacterium]